MQLRVGVAFHFYRTNKIFQICHVFNYPTRSCTRYIIVLYSVKWPTTFGRVKNMAYLRNCASPTETP